MKSFLPLLLLLAAACAAPPSNPNPAPAGPLGNIPPPAPLDPVLQRLVGEWEHRAEVPTGTDTDPTIMVSHERIDAIGPWLTSTHIHRGGEQQFEARLSLTLDPKTGRYVGTWIDSSSSHMWVYDGWVSEDGNTITLEAEGPSFTDPDTMVLYRDVTQFIGEDQRVSTSQVQGPDGEWVPMMTSEGRRLR